MDIKHLIRTIPDHPKPGIQFRDITTLLLDPDGARSAVEQLAAPFAGGQIQKVAGVEARGFIFGLAVAMELGVGFVPIRKPGKLPWETVGEDYEARIRYRSGRGTPRRDPGGRAGSAGRRPDCNRGDRGGCRSGSLSGSEAWSKLVRS